ncbi:hypothetical protein LTR66_005658 [Elasticomyces elasticus]|nr:hypothetical protein LTR66_005658 [Elasticomyces elasticus]
MMAQSFHTSNDFDPFYRLTRQSSDPYRQMSHNKPFAPYGQRPEQRAYPLMRSSIPHDTPIHEPDPDNNNSGQPRRRIAVAVGIVVGESNGLTSNSATGYGVSVPHPLATQGYGERMYTEHARSPGPELGSRAGYQPSYMPTYGDNAPIESYSLSGAGLPSSSFNSAVGMPGAYDSSRMWHSAGLKSAPVSGSFSDQGGSYSYGNYPSSYQNLPAYQEGPPYQHSVNHRLANSSTESFSPLNLTALHSSLPSPMSRRLPNPLNTQLLMTSSSAPDVVEARSLPSAAPTLHLSGIHTRSAMPWSAESLSSQSRNSSINSLASTAALAMPLPTSQSSASSSSILENGLGYVFQTSNSPDISPTTGPALSNSFSATNVPSSVASMNPPPQRYNAAGPSSLSSGTAKEVPISRHSSSSNLYSFSADTMDRHQSFGGEPAGSDGVLGSGHRYVPLHQPQPQHAGGAEALRRDSLERRSVSHRASEGSLNAKSY